MADGEQRTVLQDLEAERHVIAATMMDNSTITAACDLVSPEDFYAPRHATILEAIIRIHARGEPVDLVTLGAELRAMDRLNAVGGPQYLGELTDGTITTANVSAHAAIVSDLAVRRRHVDAARRIAAYALDHGGDELAAFAARVLREAAPKVSQKVSTAPEVALALYQRITRPRAQAEAETASVRTGLPTLDEALTLGDGRLYVIAARPAMGKSALAGQMAHNVADGRSGTVIFFAEEMPTVEVAHRDVAGRAGVNVRSAERGDLMEDGLAAYIEELNRFDKRSIVYDDTPRVSIEHIEAVCQRYAAQGRVALVVVDYLQLLSMPKAERHALAVGEVTSRLKALAKSLGCPVIAVSQLNRECEGRPDKRPVLADLRDSGSVEQDADGVLFIYRDEVYKRDSKDKGVAEIIIAKQRNGPTGTVKLRWRAEQVRFEDPSDADESYAVGGFVAGGEGG